MKTSAMKMSRFLTKDDCGKGILVTIDGDVFQENMALQGQPEELKWCISFKECEKPLSLNSINTQLIAQITGSDDTVNWNGHRIVLYDDPTIAFGGKLTGGIRVRAQRGAAATRPAPAPVNPAPAPVPTPAPTPAQMAAPAEPESDDMMPF